VSRRPCRSRFRPGRGDRRGRRKRRNNPTPARSPPPGRDR
jgi:hypothetical protein